jgi:hypothetical protein
MAATVQGTIRLDSDLTGQLPTNTYRVLASGLDRKPKVALSTERSLNGTLHVHRIMDGSVPLQHDDRIYTLLLGQSEVSQLLADLGKTMYFMPHIRDEAVPLTYRKVVVFKAILELRNLEDDPMLTYFRCTIELEEYEGGTP